MTILLGTLVQCIECIWHSTPRFLPCIFRHKNQVTVTHVAIFPPTLVCYEMLLVIPVQHNLVLYKPWMDYVNYNVRKISTKHCLKLPFLRESAGSCNPAFAVTITGLEAILTLNKSATLHVCTVQNHQFHSHDFSVKWNIIQRIIIEL